VTKADDRIRYQRERLLMDQPWFGSLAMRLNIVENRAVRTLCTDGTTVYFNPEYVDKIPDPELQSIIAEEILHCACGHLWRTGDRDKKLWNQACDQSIFSILAGAGFTIPKDSPRETKYDGKSAEQIYSLMMQDQGKDVGGSQPQPSAGEFTEPAEPDPNGDQGQGDQPGPGQIMTEIDWQIAAEQANRIAAKAGTLTADIERMTKASRQSAPDPVEMLERFIQRTIPQDYSFERPNKQYVQAGLYLPSLAKLNAPKFAIGFDSSGSIYCCRELLEMMTAFLSRILTDVKPEQIDVIYCDYDVKGTNTFTPDDGGVEFNLNVKGGGGTRFGPVFKAIEDMDEPPAALIYMTDLEGSDNHSLVEPEYPVLWVTPLTCRLTPPFGEHVLVDEWG
jgi:predicted metal-dependent peptidase